MLTPGQIAFRDAALVHNLRYKYPQLSNYSDAELVKAYNEWFLTANSTGSDNEDDFLDYIHSEKEN